MDATIEKEVDQSHREGWCVLERIIPEDRIDALRVAQPFPNVAMQLSVLWMLSPFGPETGGTWVVPRSHRDPLNPRVQEHSQK